MASGSGSRFLGLSWSGKSDPPSELTAQLRLVADGFKTIMRPGAMMLCERLEFLHQEADRGLCTAARLTPAKRPGALLDPADLFRRLLIDQQGPGGLEAPFSLVWSGGQDGSLEAATDRYGVGQLFLIERPGIVAVSNSAALLADVFECGLDAQALCGFALFGAFQESDTPFQGVAKVQAGHRVSLRHGAQTQSRYADVPAPSPGATQIPDLTGVLRETVGRMSDAAPDAFLELSGGLDSRLILAALSPQQRARHPAMTIGGRDSGDVRVAAQIAAAQGLKHVVLDLDALLPTDRDGILQTIALAASAYDYSANPIDKFPLVVANTTFGAAPRFSGQNGEILRGFYYPGQNLRGRSTHEAARRLTEWRLVTNDAVSRDLLETEAFAARQQFAKQRVADRLVSLNDTWGHALDRFYLYERMQRWVGNSAGNLLSDRTTFYPFFGSDFIASALDVRLEEKANSLAAYRLLAALDPKLAAMPLDNGLRPAAMAGSRAVAHIHQAGYYAGKVAGRISRKLKRDTRATLGSQAISKLWRSHGLQDTLPKAALRDSGLFNVQQLDRILSGEWLPDRPTLGYVLMISALLNRR